MCIAVGNVSFEDCDLLTSSLGFTYLSSSKRLPPLSTCARYAMTSLQFILDCVPLPVCQTTSGNWSSSSPLSISAQTCPMRSHLSFDKMPESKLVKAAACFRYAKARIISLGILLMSAAIGKFMTERCVCAPQ